MRPSFVRILGDKVMKSKFGGTKTAMMMEYGKKPAHNLKILLKWLFISITTGLIVGLFSVAFAYCMNYVTGFREEHVYIHLALPIAGLLIVALYKVTKKENEKGTNLVLTSISEEDDIPVTMAPLIFISTVITHLFGGSAGREGAALQLGGSIANSYGKVFKLNAADKKVIIMCGMSAAFAALFGTPMAAAIFALEVVSTGIMYYGALLPVIFSSLIASRFAADMGIHPESFHVTDIPRFYWFTGLKAIALAVVCAVVSIFFCYCLKKVKHILADKFENAYVRVVVGALIVIGLNVLLQTTDYMGAGVGVIERALEGDVVPYAFLLKIIITAITLGAGFKGGEIVPTLFIGATLGSALGPVLGMSQSLCGAIGMTALFCGVTNCPIASLLISFELFGYQGVEYFLIAVAISYLMSGYSGLYGKQKMMYSKSSIGEREN